MNYTVGAYSFNPGKKFKSNDEAVKHIQERYPELSKDEIIEHLKPSIGNESISTQKEHSESDSGSSKATGSNDKGSKA